MTLEGAAHQSSASTWLTHLVCFIQLPLVAWLVLHRKWPKTTLSLCWQRIRDGPVCYDNWFSQQKHSDKKIRYMSGLKGLTKVLSHLSKISYLQTNFHTTIRKPIGLKHGETTCLNITKCRVEVLVLLCISTSTNSHGEVFISQSHASLVPLLHKFLSRGCFSS